MPQIDSSAVLWKETDGLVIVLLIASGAFIELNKTASFIWKCIAEGAVPAEIVDKMKTLYDAPQEQLTADVKDFIENMINQGLIKP